MLSLQYLAGLHDTHAGAIHAQVKEFSIGGIPFRFNSRTALMGVINLSTDSWYQESVCRSSEEAVRRGEKLHAQGAAIVDIGAESTLAHAARAGEEAQVAQLLPVVTGLRAAGILVSVETYEPAVSRACLEAGANVLNLTGTAQAEAHYALAAEHDAAVIINHVQGPDPRQVGDFDLATDPIPRLMEDFAVQIELARRQGLEKLFLDPGLGFYYRNLQDSSTRVRHQMTTFLNTFRLRALGYPICHALPHAPEYFKEEVRCAEPFFAVLAALGQTCLFRTHEVPRIRAVLETLSVFEAEGTGDGLTLT